MFTEAHYESFVVRVWVTSAGEVDHGIVVHTPSGDLQSFRDVAEIPAIVTSSLKPRNGGSFRTLQGNGEPHHTDN